VYLKSKSNIDLTDFNFLLGSPELEGPHANRPIKSGSSVSKLRFALLDK
jgi:hypothetical protein